MYNILEFINTIIGSQQFLLVAELSSLCCKLYILIVLAIYSFRSETSKNLFILLIIFLSGAIFNDISWIMILTRSVFKITDNSIIVNFIARIGWALFITQHQALGLFLEYLITKKAQFKRRDILFTCINVILSSCFLYLAFFKSHVSSDSEETIGFERILVKLLYLYLLPLLAPVLYRIFKKIHVQEFPKILTQQLKIFIGFLIVPHLFLEHITNDNTLLAFMTSFSAKTRFALLSLSTMLCSYAIYYCCKRMMGLRFLNVKNQVESKDKFKFIKDFKGILEQLTYVTAIKELGHITQSFFKEFFDIPVSKTKLYVRKAGHDQSDINSYENYENTTDVSTKVENFIMNHDNATCPIASLLRQSKIFIKDEIEFTNFYDEQAHTTTILSFLNSINADIFLPIYERQTINAYIIVESNARLNRLFNSTERDEMLVFASYLSNIINILKHSNLKVLLQSEKELQEELYHKHQEINQCKESIRSFLRTHNERKIGILFYKGRRFNLANEAAQELIGMDINTNQGHHLAQSFKIIARKVQEYKTSQNILARNINGNRLMISGIPSLEHNAVILMVYHPEVSDIIKTQFDRLKDPSKWDYLLYLETTQSGQLINQLIPGTSETLINFKINLLATALSKKATLLQIHEDDLMPTVEILHHVSLRQTLHVLKLTVPEKSDEVAIKLFGINPLLGNNELSESLLQKLDNIGTLFIQNIHLLSIETQNYLAEFITYGFYHKFKSDQKLFSNVRIICSSTKSLHNLVAEGQFSKSLFSELKKMSLSMPSLNTLSDIEITELAHGFTEQALKNETFKNLLELSEKDKSKLLDQRPVSLQEFKTKIHQLLVQKSVKHKIYDKTEFDPAYHVSDPELAHAVRLGKKALKDPQIMAMLWDKFKNQNKIATLLGVNRSSVNRRCQEYKLYDEHN